ncbi:ThiF family adenylyltransferase [Nocardia sp. NPDC052254]|uniref:ThiF family adenylyltransferase n=1 Tax=Nocardia sp. NPDC052254 TaxID=3155681 RepID=UPI00342B1F48
MTTTETTMTEVQEKQPRYGVSGRTIADRASGGEPVEQRWQFSTQWEMLELADGSLFFDSVYADHRVVASPPPVLRRILRMIDEDNPSLVAVARKVAPGGDRATVEQVERLLDPFFRAGILVPVRSDDRPEWADDELVERFSTQLEWLGSLSAESRGHWDYFGRLRRAHVAILGLGGAGSLLAQALTAVGVGRLTLVDGDTIESSNLVRQIFYHPDQIGLGKVDSMAEQLRRFSPYTRYDVMPEYIRGADDVSRCIEGADFVAVCADAPRFVLNRWIDTACKAGRVPYLGAFSGAVGPMYRPGKPGCFGCLEHRFRSELGDRHDLLVDALAAKTSWRYPSFVSGPLAVAQLMTTEIVMHLTEAAEPSCAGNVIRFQHPHTVPEPIAAHPDCDCSTEVG